MIKYLSYLLELLRIINQHEIAFISVCLIYYIIISISLYFIYIRIGKKKKSAIVPFMNIVSLLELVSLPKLLVLLVFIPYINFVGVFVVSLFINVRLGKALNLNFLNRLGLVLLPIIFMPIIATKHLEYTKLPPSRMLKVDEEIEEEEEEEFVLDVKYKLDEVAVGTAYDITQFLSEGLDKKVLEVVEEEEVVNEVADLTFDYNDLYNNNKDKA